MKIAEWLDVRVFKFSELIKEDSAYTELSKFSAFCVNLAGDCAVIVNDKHSDSRINSSLCHEFAHLLLCHKTEVISASYNSCRDFDSEKEQEADWLAGAILIPKKAAQNIVFSDMTLPQAAIQYGVSLKMLKYRLNVSGANTMKERAIKKRQRP